MKKIVSCIRSGGLTLATMSGVIGGVVFGLVLRSCKEKWSDREVINWAVIGQYHITWLNTVLWLVNDSNTELWLVKILGDVCILCWRDIPEDAEGSDSPTDCTISDHCSGILGYVFVRCEKIFKTFKYFWFYWGRVGGRAITYYLSTTGLAVVLGIILVVTVHPGVSGQEKVKYFFSSQQWSLNDLFIVE